ncbi:uncharacterized protein LOC130705520 [Balaenoptera acutorostrata]|uniref:Uncharacterized protein LOC130705520 n=1 Tax=Balaenoptera acutorostrata TaxID=9767 RepID=A0ABM3SDR6_BALAC|nr:uncharacterized protein LOC130705520 [Balaenoptera acutorostrata]
MCSAAARARPAGARGWRAARDVTAARAPGCGGGESARRPTGRVRPRPQRCPRPRAPRRPARRPASPSARGRSGSGHLAAEGRAGGGEGLGRRGPRWRGEGTRRTGLRVLAALAPRPEGASSNPVVMPIHLRAAVSAVLLSVSRPAPRGPGGRESSHLPDGEGEFTEIGELRSSEMGALRAEDPWLSSIPSDLDASLGTTSICGPEPRTGPKQGAVSVQFIIYGALRGTRRPARRWGHKP